MFTTIKIHLQAFVDLFKRYFAVTAAVWAVRKELAAPARTQEEAEFLPAALALQETPISPAPRVTMWVLMCLLVIALIWSLVGEIDITATAQGKVVPSGRTKVIQPLETAAIKAIHVRDGSEVKAGDVLVELDAAAANADTRKAEEELNNARLQSARAEALITALEHRRRPAPIWPNGVTAPRLQQEEMVLAGQYQDTQAKLVRIEEDIVRREAELGTLREQVAMLEQSAVLAREKAQDYLPLVADGVVSKHEYLDIQRAKIETEGELAAQRSRILELKANIAQGRAEYAAVLSEAKRTALDEFSQGRKQSDSQEQELAKASVRGRYMTIVSPVDGTVQQLAIHTVGGVVTPAQPLMSIVPKQSGIELEVEISNKDIGFIEEGQEAQVKLETFLFTKYGVVPAKVTHVSRDAREDEKKGLIYTARVAVDVTYLNVDGRRANLAPGMAATVEIKTGTRRVIDFLLSPLKQHSSQAWRER